MVGDIGFGVEIICELAWTAIGGMAVTVEKPNPTNHLRPAGGGAFILPSVGRFPVLPPSDTPTSATARQSAIKPDPVHGC
jgi:hypothetical protein